MHKEKKKLEVKKILHQSGPLHVSLWLITKTWKFIAAALNYYCYFSKVEPHALLPFIETNLSHANDFKKSKMTKKKMYRMSMGQLQPCNNSNNVSGPQPQRTRGGTSWKIEEDSSCLVSKISNLSNCVRALLTLKMHVSVATQRKIRNQQVL